MLPDGDVVVVGSTGFGGADALVARVNSDGSLDPAFGDGGTVSMDLNPSPSTEHMSAAALAPNGDLVVAGTVFASDDTDLMLLRLRPDGSFDPGFGDRGVLVIDVIDGGHEWASAVVVRADGRIVVGASVLSAPSFLLGLLADGRPDPSFGSGGPVASLVGGDPDTGTPAVVLDGDTLLVAGTAGAPGAADLGLARHHDDGEIDTGFGSDGLARVDVDGAGRDDSVWALATGPRGIMVAGGTLVDDQFPEPRRDAAVARFLPDGTPDPSFGGDGTVVADFPRAADSPAETVAVLGDGRVVLAGRDRLFTGATMQTRVARLLPDGSLEPAFDGDGFVRIPVGPSGDVDLGVLADEDLVVSGSTVGPNGDRDLFVARLDGAGEDLPLYSVADTTVAEGEPGFFEIDVVLSAPVSRPTTVGVRTVAGSAGIYDFTPLDANFPFAPGQTRARVQIPIRDDEEVEPEERFSVVLWDPEGAGIGGGTATVRILDEDPEPTVSVDDVSVGEGATAVFTVRLSHASPATVTLSASAQPGSAAAGADFEAGYWPIEFRPGEVAVPLPVRTVVDDIDEPDESFGLVLAPSSMRNTRPGRATAVGTILDDDLPPTTTTTTTAPTSTTSLVPPTSTTTIAPTTTTTAPLLTTTTTTPTASTTTTSRPSTATTTAPRVTTVAPPLPARSGYWMLDRGGQVYAFGDARQVGGTTGGEAVDIEPSPVAGYWVVDRSGSVDSFGGAPDLGSLGRRLEGDEGVTSLAAHPDGRGYWLFTSRGRVIPFGSARFLGDMSAAPLNGPVLDSIATPSGNGYYLVASDGGIFAFGDARFKGSMGGARLNAPVQSLVPDRDGSGYWLVASDGGVFAFDAPFRGSMGDARLNRPVTGMVRLGGGYLMVAEDGGIFNFSEKPFHGSLGDRPPSQPIVAVAPYE